MPKPIYHPTMDAQRTQLDHRRRSSDGVAELGEGFTRRVHGRDGMIYYREGERLLEFAYEADGTGPGILLYLTGLDTWILPAPKPLSQQERTRIRDALQGWANTQTIRVTFVSADDLIRPWESSET